MERTRHGFSDPAEASDQHGLLGEALLVVAEDMKFAALQVTELLSQAAVQRDDHPHRRLRNAARPAAGIAVELHVCGKRCHGQVVDARPRRLYHARMPQQLLLFFGEVAHDIVREYDIGGANGREPLVFSHFFHPRNLAVRKECFHFFLEILLDWRGNGYTHRFFSFISANEFQG